MSTNRRNRRSRKTEPRESQPLPADLRAATEEPCLQAPRAGWWPLIAAAVIIVAGGIAYCNSFGGPFVFDDVESISTNPYIRKLWPITEAIKAPPQETVSGRPVVSYSLAVNYAISGLDVWSYHIFNLVVHLLAGLTLFGVIRRTLNCPRLKDRFARASLPLALICTVIWLVHPLQTQAVTYVVQRTESMMAMFYLLTLYCVIRGMSSPRGPWWYVQAVVFCAIGMGTKEVMVTAPIMVLIYDRIFVAGSFRKLFQRRWALYAALATCWVILAAIVLNSPRGQSAGFGLETIAPLDYAKTQAQVILHYLKLAFWPANQVLDYSGWPMPTGATLYLSAAGILLLLTLTVVMLIRMPAAGFVGGWFFLILGPTSSFMPINDLVFEHRMYLSLAAVVAGCVLPGYLLYSRLAARRAIGWKAWLPGYFLVVALVVALTLVTLSRNRDYSTDIALWQDNIAKWPGNGRAHNNLGLAYAGVADYANAIEQYTLAVKYKPNYTIAYSNRGVAYAKSGNNQRALEDFSEAIELYMAEVAQAYGSKETIPPNMRKKYASGFGNRGIVYKNTGKFKLAIGDYNESLSVYPDNPVTLYNRAIVYQRIGDFDRALVDLGRAVELDPTMAATYDARGVSYWHKKDFRRAVEEFDKAIRLDPSDPSYRKNRQAAAKSLDGGDK